MVVSRYGGWLLVLGQFLGQSTVLAQGLTVTGHVSLIAAARKERAAASAVVWLAPLQNDAAPLTSAQARGPFRLVQKNKRFTPHILVVPVGAMVEFPNDDPFFHNVFSLFDGKRFDLGLYEAGTTRRITFGAPGVSYIFCNIHPEMSAVVIALKTPYYAVADTSGRIAMRDVPAGRYQLSVWHERCLPDVLKSLSRAVAVSPLSPSLGDLQLPEAGDLLTQHKNKYGRDYEPPGSSDQMYGEP